MAIAEVLRKREVRDILLVADGRPLTARQISDATGVPIAPCYRRLRLLQKLGLVEVEGVKVGSGGRARQVFSSHMERLEVFLQGDRIKGRIRLPVSSQSSGRP